MDARKVDHDVSCLLIAEASGELRNTDCSTLNSGWPARMTRNYSNGLVVDIASHRNIRAMNHVAKKMTVKMSKISNSVLLSRSTKRAAAIKKPHTYVHQLKKKNIWSVGLNRGLRSRGSGGRKLLDITAVSLMFRFVMTRL